MWDMVIRAKRVSNLLPVLEAILSGLSRNGGNLSHNEGDLSRNEGEPSVVLEENKTLNI
jgi:hypothetical protein